MSIVLLSLLIFLIISYQAIPVQAESPSKAGLLVHLPSSSARQQIANSFQLQVMDIGLAEIGIYGVVTPPGKMDSTYEELKNSPLVLGVEPNYPIQILEDIPNDPAFPDQYALTAIHAAQGWSIENGSRNIRIAILDTGVDFNHPDLSGQLVPGYDIFNDDNYAQDDHGHGTAVAGIAAASTNNGLGMAGVGWQVQIMPVKVLGSGGSGTYGDVASGILWAVSQQVQVINLSLGGVNQSFTMEFAVKYAVSKGVLVVAASGNNGSEGVLYPARYPEVIAVAATDQANKHATFSTYGADVDVAAPGVQVYTTSLGGGFSKRTGTSFSTPHVSGLAALLFSLPGQVTAEQVRAAIESSSADVEEPGWDPYTGYGLIQVDAALNAIGMIPAVAPGLAGITPTSGDLQTTDSPVLIEDQTIDPATSTESPTYAQETSQEEIIPAQPTSGTLTGIPDQEISQNPEGSSAGSSSMIWLGLGLAITGTGLVIYYYWLRSYGRR